MLIEVIQVKGFLPIIGGNYLVHDMGSLNRKRCLVLAQQGYLHRLLLRLQLLEKVPFLIEN